VPFVTIQINRKGSGLGRDAATPEEKAALIKGVSELLLNVLDKPLHSTFVVIDEVALNNWEWGGLPILKIVRKRRPRLN
jgi:4-oxalocrotonate tautomerase